MRRQAGDDPLDELERRRARHRRDDRPAGAPGAKPGGSPPYHRRGLVEDQAELEIRDFHPLDPQLTGAELQAISVRHPRAGDAGAVDEGAVLASQIFEPELLAVQAQDGVLPRDLTDDEHDVVDARAAETVFAGLESEKTDVVVDVGPQTKVVGDLGRCFAFHSGPALQEPCLTVTVQGRAIRHHTMPRISSRAAEAPTHTAQHAHTLGVEKASCP